MAPEIIAIRLLPCKDLYELPEYEPIAATYLYIVEELTMEEYVGWPAYQPGRELAVRQVENK